MCLCIFIQKFNIGSKIRALYVRTIFSVLKQVPVEYLATLLRIWWAPGF